MYFATDIGGSRTRVAGSKDCISFDEPVIFNTFKNLPENLSEIKKVILEKSEKVGGKS